MIPCIFPENFPAFQQDEEISAMEISALNGVMQRKLLTFAFAYVSRPDLFSFARTEMICLRKWFGVNKAIEITGNLINNRVTISDQLENKLSDDVRFFVKFRLDFAIFTLYIHSAHLEVLSKPYLNRPNQFITGMINQARGIFLKSLRPNFKRAKRIAPENSGNWTKESLSEFVFSEVFPFAIPLLPGDILPKLVGMEDDGGRLAFEDSEKTWKLANEIDRCWEFILPLHLHAADSAKKHRIAWREEVRKKIEDGDEETKPRLPTSVKEVSKSLESKISLAQNSERKPAGPWRWAGKIVIPAQQAIQSHSSKLSKSDESVKKISQDDFAALCREWAAEEEGDSQLSIPGDLKSRRRSSLLSTENFYEGKNLPAAPAIDDRTNFQVPQPYCARSPKKRRRGGSGESLKEKSPTVAMVVQNSPIPKMGRLLVAPTPEVSNSTRRTGLGNFSVLKGMPSIAPFDLSDTFRRLAVEEGKSINIQKKMEHAPLSYFSDENQDSPKQQNHAISDPKLQATSPTDSETSARRTSLASLIAWDEPEGPRRSSRRKSLD